MVKVWEVRFPRFHRDPDALERPNDDHAIGQIRLSNLNSKLALDRHHALAARVLDILDDEPEAERGGDAERGQSPVRHTCGDHGAD